MLRGKRSEHDNGAADAPPRKSKKNSSKLEQALKELAEVKSANAHLNEKLSKANETISSLQTSLKIPMREPSDVNSEDFIADLGPSSTRRHESAPVEVSSREMTRFMSSMNQISVSSISVPECKPKMDGEEISRHDFEAWRDLLLDSLKLAGVMDEATKFIIFKVKAGQTLLDVFKNTKSGEDAPNENDLPFLNAMHRLKSFFASGSDLMLQRRKLALMIQKKEESDLAFLMRVGATARLCEFGDSKEFEEIVGTVAEHAKNREVRTTALKLLSRKGTFADLVDKVREIEAIRLNEEYFRMKHCETEPLTVARVAVGSSSGGGNTRQWQGGRPANRGRYSTQQSRRGGEHHDHRQVGAGWRSTTEQSQVRCFRCHSLYHKSYDCYAINKICLSCGRIGHLQRACRSLSHAESSQLKVERSSGTRTADIAAVDTKQEDIPVEDITKEIVSDVP